MANELRIALGAMRVVTSFTRAADLVDPFYRKESFEVVAAQAMMFACRNAFARIHLAAMESLAKATLQAQNASGFPEHHLRGHDSDRHTYDRFS